MLAGLFSGGLPPALSELSGSIRQGRVVYSALLTQKGKIVSDLRVARLTNGEEGRLLVEFPPEGYEGAIERMRQYLPPRFAALSEPEEPFGVMTLIGPRAAELIDADVRVIGTTPDKMVLLYAPMDGSPLYLWQFDALAATSTDGPGN
jgi:glycine cleavage system aminomethyltransferase T